MRQRPYAFLRVGPRWINMALVTDIEDHDDRLVVFVSADMARRVGSDAVDVARRFDVDDPADVDKLRRWLKLNDVE